QLQARGKFLESQATAAGQVAGDPTGANYRTAQRVHLQNEDDPDFQSRLKGAIAGAESMARIPAAQAMVPVEAAKAGAVSSAELQAKETLARLTSGLTEGREGRLLGLRIKEEAMRPTLGLAAANAFRSQNEPLVNTVNNYAQA